MISASIRKTFAVFLAFMVCLNGCGQNSDVSETAEMEDSMQKYVEELLNIDLKDYIVAEDGEIEKTDTTHNARIALQLAPGSKEAVAEILSNACGGKFPLEDHIIPGYSGHRLAKQMKSQALCAVYVRLLPGLTTSSGEHMGTRSITIYLTQDDEGTDWLYLFG